MMRFQGQTHVVVGGGSFWGRAVSQQLAREGAHVAVIDSDAAAVNETCALIAGENGGRSTGFPVNIEDARALADVAAKLDAAGAVVRSLVTHYLVLDWHSVEDCDVAQFERVVIHNLVGPLKATQAFLPLLKKAGKGAILHLGSVDGLLGNPRLASYSVSKGGIVPLTKISAHDFARYNIRVNAIASAQTIEMSEEERVNPNKPGLAGFPGSGHDYVRQLNAATPLKRYGPLTDWAKAATFLVSNDADYMTGAIVVVDCGRLAITPGTA
jgi:NAD(P)-dependent dehydrogenase (short-subunit alcohol dehydrogenase family)